MRLRNLVLFLALCLPTTGCGTSLAFILNQESQYYGFQGVALDGVGVLLTGAEGPEYIPLSILAFIDIPFSLVGDILSYPYILTTRQLSKREAKLLEDPAYQREKLKHDSAFEREAAARNLGKLAKKDPEAYKVLLKTMIEDDDIGVRSTCAQALASFPNSDDEVFEALAVAARQREPLRSMAVSALDRLSRENAKAADCFCRALSQDDADYEGLIELPESKNQVRILSQLLTSKSKFIRIYAAHRLAKN
ncbi:MAG: HEAT repeat domain-containing protein, partial [Planctomycetota bacterium]|nr:HEAT repeat domain-containing protein [Planctomycetota bacterium]